MTATALETARPARQRGVEHHEILVVGGGAGGLSVASRLRRVLPQAGVAVLEPSERHFYQPLWTLVGGGVFRKEQSVREQASVIPKGAEWIRDAAAELRPAENAVLTVGGRRLEYEVLVLAPGIQIDWDAVPGLAGAVGRDGVSSNWSYETVDRTWEFIRDFRGGTALFTCPSTPVKCPGAAQKVMYLADDQFRRSRVRDRSSVVFATAGPGIFAVERYARTLRRVLERRGIDLLVRHDLVELRPGSREAVFRRLDTGGQRILRYDLLHVTPPQSAPDFVKTSPLADEAGWLELDRHTLRHPRFPNVYGLGDATSLPTSKTAAAVRAQAKVLVANLAAARAGTEPRAAYDGYTACPIVTGYGKLVLAEFDYDLQPSETFPFDQSKERYSMWLLKKHALAPLYWHGMLRGRA